MPDSSLELIIFSAVIALVITYMVVRIPNLVINWTWKSIISLLMFAVIIKMLNFLGFPLWADILELGHSFPPKAVEFIKMSFGWI